MKFTCKTKELAHAVGIVSRAINVHQTIPILGNILFTLQGKRCTLSATNLEFSIITSIPAEVENEGEITIPAKAIQNFAQYAIDDAVLFESVEAVQLRCVSPKMKTTIVGESATEYPTITPIQKDVSFTLSEKEFIKALHLTTFCATHTTTRPVLSGVHLHGGGSTLTLVSTDSYRLSEYQLSTKGAQNSFTCIIPSRVLEELKTLSPTSRSGGEEEGQRNLSITLSSQQVEIRAGETTLLSRLIDGRFPDYKQIIPKKSDSTVTIPLAELTSAIRRMHYFAKEVNNSITFSLSPGSLHLRTQKTQIGTDESTLPIELKGGGAKIALSSSYLLDFLSRLQGESVTMEVSDATHPAVFRSTPVPSFLHLIMPLRLVEEG